MSLSDKLSEIKWILLSSWNKGAVVGKEMKKSHKKKMKKLGGKKNGK